LTLELGTISICSCGVVGVGSGAPDTTTTDALHALTSRSHSSYTISSLVSVCGGDLILNYSTKGICNSRHVRKDVVLGDSVGRLVGGENSIELGSKI